MIRRRKKSEGRSQRPRATTAIAGKSSSAEPTELQVVASLFSDEAELIQELHHNFMRQARLGLEQAAQIGELFVQIKNNLEHGQWLPWLEAHVQFHHTWVNFYVRCFQKQERLEIALETETTVSLSQIRRLMAGTGQRPKGKEPKPEPAPAENVVPFDESEGEADTRKPKRKGFDDESERVERLNALHRVTDLYSGTRRTARVTSLNYSDGRTRSVEDSVYGVPKSDGHMETPAAIRNFEQQEGGAV